MNESPKAILNKLHASEAVIHCAIRVGDVTSDRMTDLVDALIDQGLITQRQGCDVDNIACVSTLATSLAANVAAVRQFGEEIDADEHIERHVTAVRELAKDMLRGIAIQDAGGLQ